MADMVRINSRVSKDVNEWLDNESERSGVPKSTLVFLALEQYINQKQVMRSMTDLTPLLAKLGELEASVNKDKETD